jgi:acyl transferase domain-containing protein
MRRDARNTSELLAAYVDGVAELTSDERKRVEARLADDGALRRDADDVRALLGELRELPAHPSEPDWSALERSIGEAVGPEVPRSWWRRRWRWIVPALGVVTAAALLALLLHRPDTPVNAPEIAVPQPLAPQVRDTVALWLDGRAIEVGPSTAARALDELDDDELLESDAALVPTSGDVLEDPGFAFLDDLDDATLERVRAALEQDPPPRKKG